MKNSDNKYYTPEMNEFHPEFEFEYLSDNGWKKHNLGGSPIINKDLDQFKDDLMKIAHAITRVKHLDREDIEECNFEYSALAKKYFLKGSLTDVEFSGLWLENIKNSVYVINDCRMPMHRTIFYGTIKNKSELKRLLKQLQII